MGGVTRFFKQHRKWLTVIGGVVLFVTFLIKEGFRESAKDQLAAIVTAESEFKLNTNHRAEMDAINRGPHTRGFAEAQGPIGTQLQAYTVASEYHTDSHLADLFDTENLASSLPSNADLAEKQKTVTTETEKIDKMYSEFTKSISRETQYDPSTPEQKKLIHEMSLKQAAVQDALTAYTKATLEASQQHHEKVKTRYERFTIASYFLFTFGLIISILGKLLEPSDDALDVEV